MLHSKKPSNFFSNYVFIFEQCPKFATKMAWNSHCDCQKASTDECTLTDSTIVVSSEGTVVQLMFYGSVVLMDILNAELKEYVYL